MYVSKSAMTSGGSANDAARRDDVPVHEARDIASERLQTVIYLDSRALTRDCVGGWLQSCLSGFMVRALPDPDQIAIVPTVNARIRAVIIYAGSDPISSSTVARPLSRVRELFPDCPVAVLSDYEDPESVREAFHLGVRGYIPTSLASLVAVEAVRLVCAGGTFAPTAALLCQGDHPPPATGEPPLESFTRRQWQILDCLRRGMANRLIASELSMCESTVKVHIRNIMKKLNAANRTEVAYLTRGLFEGASQRDATL